MSDYAKKFVKKVLMVFCMSFVGMFALLCLFMSIRERSSGFEAEQSSDTEEVTGQEESGDTTAQEEQTEGEKLAQQWGIRISAREKMDLHRVLLEDDFRLFSGHDVDSRLSESFSFAYPKNLYHTVEAEADEDAGRYRISFRGKDNSALLSYSQERREEDADSIEEMYEEDKDTLSDAETLLHLGTVYLVTGFEEDGALELHKVVKMDEENIYVMIIKTPVPEKADEQSLLSFYTEYLYRSCAFSGSSREPRSYGEFLTGNE